MKTSKYRGVFFRQHKKRWQSSIKIDKKEYLIGHFENEIDASDAYEIVRGSRVALAEELSRIVDDDPRQRKKAKFFKAFVKDLLAIADITLPVEKRQVGGFRGRPAPLNIHKQH